MQRAQPAGRSDCRGHRRGPEHVAITLNSCGSTLSLFRNSAQERPRKTAGNAVKRASPFMTTTVGVFR